MSTLRRLRNFWIPWVTTIVLACFSGAVAQRRYKITDLGTNHSDDNFSMAMGLNNQGWAENMDGFVNPPENNLFTTVARGRAVININGRNIDLGTLGKPDGNSWINWGGINDRGEAVDRLRFSHVLIRRDSGLARALPARGWRAAYSDETYILLAP